MRTTRGALFWLIIYLFDVKPNLLGKLCGFNESLLDFLIYLKHFLYYFRIKLTCLLNVTHSPPCPTVIEKK